MTRTAAVRVQIGNLQYNAHMRMAETTAIRIWACIFIMRKGLWDGMIVRFHSRSQFYYE